MMNDNSLFDDIARSLASPIPRRQACARILRGLAGAALASVFGVGTAHAGQKSCPPGQPACGTTCCPKGWICCDSTTGLCCNKGQTCDGKNCKSSVSQSVLDSDGR